MANVIMKANGAPDKIYLHPDLDSIFGMTERSCESEIEYTRTDAFIEKTFKWIEEHFMNRLEWEIATYEFKDIQSLKEEFKKTIILWNNT